MSPLPLSCSFCNQPNPADAKFCNQCGSPLGFKPCPSCEAVNEKSAGRCHQCGVAFIEAQADVATTVADSAAAEAASHALADEIRAEASVDAVDAKASPSGDEPVVAAPFAADESVSPGDESIRASPLAAERASPSGEESIVTAPFAADAALDAPIHIPESLADRLEREAGPHAFERVEPRIAPSNDRDEVHDFAAASRVLRNRRMTARSRAWRAPLVLAVLVLIASAGYYAYRQDAPGIDRLAALALAAWHGGESASAEHQPNEVPRPATGSNDAAASASSTSTQSAQGTSTSATPATAARGATNAATPAVAAQSATSPATPATASSDARSSSELNPAGSALVSVEPGAPGRATAGRENVAPSPTTAVKAKRSSSLSRNDDETASQRSESASRSRRQADADAVATQRLIARDLGIPTPPPASEPSAPLDRDAAETQRLIERDLGPFLHRNGGSSTQGPYPASR